MSSIKKISGVVLIGAVLAMAGCGNSDSTTTGGLGGTTGTTGGGTAGGGTGSTTTGSSDNTAHTIVLTYPHMDSIEVVGSGIYRRVGAAIVTDNEGNPVPDGTKIYLNVVDSILAQGVIGAGDSVAGAVLTDVNPLLGDGATSTTFDTAYVYRNYEYHFIEPTDHVLLFNADSSDINRLISSSGITANTLTMTSDYSMTYPATPYYTTGTSEYKVGVSALGAAVLGTDADGNMTSDGYAITKNGKADFYVMYPANVGSILTGCYSDASVDTRVLPVGSAQVLLIASAGENATTVDSNFCFNAIAGGTLKASPAAISGDSAVKVQFRDGGDEVLLPFERVNASVVTTGTADITLSGGYVDATTTPNGYYYLTNSSGSFNAGVILNGGATTNKATITFVSAVEPDVKVDVVLTIP